MWRWVVLLAGCGRLGFDPLGDAGGGGGDGGIDAPNLVLEAGTCPGGYMHVATSCYRVVQQMAASWLTAEQTCEADAVGAHMVVIGDEAERLVVHNIAPGARSWIGTSKRVSAYRTVIGTDGFLALGVQTEPSEDCLSIHGDGLMYLHTCGDQNDYVCEFDGIPADPAAF